eukprot:SAG31_NODE_565_length_14056_cov_22.573189_4_plen_85_part_00
MRPMGHGGMGMGMALGLAPAAAWAIRCIEVHVHVHSCTYVIDVRLDGLVQVYTAVYRVRSRDFPHRGPQPLSGPFPKTFCTDLR